MKRKLNKTPDAKQFYISERKILNEDGKIYLTGYANTKGHADSYGDIPTSFNGQPVYVLDFMAKNPVCFVDHYPSASNIAGNFVELKEDEKGLWFKLLFRDLKDIFNPDVKDAVSAWQAGFGRALSIGGRWFHEDTTNPNHLTKAVLREISLVGIGADHEALTDVDYPKSHPADIPVAPLDTKWDAEGAIERVTAFSSALGGGAPPTPDVLDVIDGKLMAIPVAIFAAAGKAEAPTEEFEGYYKKMGMDSPFKSSSTRLDDFNCLNEKELEMLLKSGICFSSQKAKAVMSALKLAGLRDAGQAGNRDGNEELKSIGESIQKTLDKIKKGVA